MNKAVSVRQVLMVRPFVLKGVDRN